MKRKRLVTNLVAESPAIVVDKKHRAWFLFAIIFAGVLVYANSLRGEFLWDDEGLVQNNPYLKNLSLLPRVFTRDITAGEGGESNFYRPVQMLTYAVDYALWKNNTLGYHLGNLFWHILTALCVYGLIELLFFDAALAFLTALFFIIHPVHTEAVAYISGRADSLAAFFMLLTFILYLKSEQKRSLSLLAGMGLSYALALLSRENSMIFPALILFYHGVFGKPLHKKPFVVLAATLLGYLAWRGILIHERLSVDIATPTLLERLPGVFVAFAQYLRLLFWPFDLHMEYGGLLFDLREVRFWLGLVLFLGLFSYTFYRRKKDRLFLFGAGWFLLTLLPSLNLFFAINAYMAEHWLYLPLIGFALIASRSLLQFCRHERFSLIGLLLVLAAAVYYGIITLHQNAYWKDAVTLYKRMAELAPYSSKLYNNLAKAYHDAGKDNELLELLRHSIKIDSNNAVAYNNLGNTYKDLGRFDEAIASYEKAIALKPTHAGFYYNLSLIYADKKGDYAKAKDLLAKALAVNPYFSPVHHKLGLIALSEGNKDEATALIKKAIQINPEHAELHHSLGYIHTLNSDLENARRAYERAIELNPRLGKAYHDLAVLYYSTGDIAQATVYYKKAVDYGESDELLSQALKNS